MSYNRFIRVSKEFFMDEMRVTIALEKEHYFEFLMKHIYTGIKGLLYVLLTIALLLVVILTWNNKVFGVYNIFMIFLLLYMYIGQPIHLYFEAARRAKIMRENGSLITYQITKDALGIGGGQNPVEIPWAGMKKIKETQNLVLFYVDRKQALVLPKEQVENWKDILEIARASAKK